MYSTTPSHENFDIDDESTLGSIDAISAELPTDHPANCPGSPVVPWLNRLHASRQRR